MHSAVHLHVHMSIYVYLHPSARIISTIHPTHKRPLLSFLAKFYSQQSYVGQRTVATAMLAEFVNHSSEDQMLLKELIKFLLPQVADKVRVDVRCVRR